MISKFWTLWFFFQKPKNHPPTKYQKPSQSIMQQQHRPINTIKKATTSSIKAKLQKLGPGKIPTDDYNNPVYKCDICDCIFNSKESSDQHFSGRKHSLQVMRNEVATKNNVTQNNSTNSTSTLYDLHCGICNKNFNSQNSAEQHFTGKNHSLMVAGDNYFAKTPSGEYNCAPCNTTLTSETQLTQHLSGAKHKMAVGIIRDTPNKYRGKCYL